MKFVVNILFLCQISKAIATKREIMSEKRVIPASELIINEDGSIFHLHLRPEQISDIVMLVGDPARVDLIASYFDSVE